MAEVMEEAPGELETVRLFVNTLHDNLSDEELPDPGALRKWLRAHGIADPRLQPGPADLRRAREVREALRKLLLANNGGPSDANAVELLNRTATRAKVGATLDDHSAWRL